ATVRQKNSKRVPISVIDRDKGFAAEPEQSPEPAQPDIAAKPEVKIKKLGKEALEAETEKIREEIEKSDNVQDTVEYRYPPVDLLRSPLSSRSDAKDEILLNRTRLESALHSFGINANIVNIIHGPTVTRFDIELEQGVKLSRVTNLSGDLALSLGVINVRIAPIPDKISTVGIEVPNRIVNTVYLREIIESDAFTAAKSKLSFAIGKDIGGNCIVGNISKLPHMLIAGTTGSGKSVCMNSLILSLLYKAAPDEVKMIMIDPKMVELGIYNGIPHLYVPVVTDPKKAAGALQWSVVEMLKRYRLFSEAGVRDLATYNSRVTDENGKLPQVVIVIDELADLMIAASKEVEESICRVAQMGRAAGMHLIIATQRPSADVITGLMKANIPSRIAFAVSSAMESRIILDQSGAEKLVGMGDMLFSPVGSGKPVRIQGAFVSDEEREEVIRFVKEQAVPSEASAELKEFMEKAAEDKSSGDHGKSEPESARSGDYDELLPKAVEAVLEMKSCSVSMLQRRVKLGYSRAARIVDQMEELGIVGPYEGAKPRALTIDNARWQEMKIELGFASEDEIRNAEIISEQAEEDFADQ
ncbi:MAG: DNA translocase FtsK, partial [Oscillospiraceae bacterium]|nr:DNA translocase FtsK [Oscillospiraceae bacterium]